MTTSFLAPFDHLHALRMLGPESRLLLFMGVFRYMLLEQCISFLVLVVIDELINEFLYLTDTSLEYFTPLFLWALDLASSHFLEIIKQRRCHYFFRHVVYLWQVATKYLITGNIKLFGCFDQSSSLHLSRRMMPPPSLVIFFCQVDRVLTNSGSCGKSRLIKETFMGVESIIYQFDFWRGWRRTLILFYGSVENSYSIFGHEFFSFSHVRPSVVDPVVYVFEVVDESDYVGV